VVKPHNKRKKAGKRKVSPRRAKPRARNVVSVGVGKLGQIAATDACEAEEKAVSGVTRRYVPFPWEELERRAALRRAPDPEAGQTAPHSVEASAEVEVAVEVDDSDAPGAMAHQRALEIAARHRRSRIRAQVIGVVLSLSGLGLGAYIGQRIAADTAAQSWPSVAGKITLSQRSLMSRNPDRYETHFIYEFKTNGRYYSSRRVRFAGGQGDPTASRRVGDKVKVFYDPADPNRAVLEPGVILWAWAQLGACLVVALLGALYVFLSRRGRPA